MHHWCVAVSFFPCFFHSNGKKDEKKKRVFGITQWSLWFTHACSGFILNVYLFIASDIGNYTLILHWFRFIWHSNICRRVVAHTGKKEKSITQMLFYFVVVVSFFFCRFGFLVCWKGQWNKQNAKEKKKKKNRFVWFLSCFCYVILGILALINIYTVRILFGWVSFRFAFKGKFKIKNSPFNWHTEYVILLKF